MELRQAVTQDDIARARQLFEEYAASLDFSLCFQNFDEELAGLPGGYAPPEGALLLAYSSDQVAGCVALRALETGVCEMKRLYVKPAFRGLGLGKKLVDAIIAEGRRKGYRAMRLDSAPMQERAQALYRKVGFVDIESYNGNPMDGVRYMELSLGA